MVSTNYEKISVSSTAFGTPSPSGDVLLLQNGDKFLLQNGNGLLLEEGELKSVDYTGVSYPSTDYTKPS